MDGGKTWTNLTNFTDLPQGATANFVTVEASHTDINTAYVVANIAGGRAAGAADDGGPTPADQNWVYRTHDAGKSWTRIVNGLPADERTGSQVHVIREDPKQKGLLFLGTETTVFVSFDDGDNWQSLRNNLPSTSIRDMVFHTDDHMNDLVITTYGRGFWVLDDMSPLRDIAAKGQAIAGGTGVFVQTGRRHFARVRTRTGSASQSRTAALLESTVRRNHLLPPQPQADVRDPAANLRLGKQAGAHDHEHAAAAVRAAAISGLLAETIRGSRACDRCRTSRINWDLRYDDPPGYNPDINNQMNTSPSEVTPGPHGPLALPGTYTSS